jgi:galactose-1-phosphate uridylyltransferase
MTRRQRARRWSFVADAWVTSLGGDTAFIVAPYMGAWCVEIWIGANQAAFHSGLTRREAFKIASAIRQSWAYQDRQARCKR